MDLNTIIGGVTLLSIGIGIGLLRSNYVTKKDFDDHVKDCECSLGKKFDEVNQARKDIWAKIDKIYDWMLEAKK